MHPTDSGVLPLSSERHWESALEIGRYVKISEYISLLGIELEDIGKTFEAEEGE